MDSTNHEITITLFIMGNSVNSLKAKANLTEFCNHYLKRPFVLNVVDISINPELAIENHILAIPTAIIAIGRTKHRIVGTLSDFNRLKELFPGGGEQ